MHQYINSNSRPYVFFFFIHFDCLPSQFIILDPSYLFPLMSSKLSSVFLALFFESFKLYQFINTQIILNDFHSSFLYIFNS